MKNRGKANNSIITVIGGANMDIHGIPLDKCILKDSNPGEISYQLGGVGRNIGENLSKLQLSVRLLISIGEDDYGEKILIHAKESGIDIEDCLITKKRNTATYMYITDKDGDMVVAIADMGIMDYMDEYYFKNRISRIDKSEYTVVDTNLTQKSLEFLLGELKNTKVVLETVSGAKAVRAKNVIHLLHAIKTNRLEAEKILGIALDTNESIIKAGKTFIELGCKKVMISLGKEGVFYTDGNDSFFGLALDLDPVNTTGAGDAVTSAFVYALYNNMEVEKLVRFCIGAGTLTMLSNKTISDDFSVKNICNIIEK